MTYKEKAAKILEKIGGKENISAVTYCMTRLRITPKDRGLIDDSAICAIPGIIGTKSVGAQYQVIIGPEVEHVYNEFCDLAGVAISKQIDENVDTKIGKEKKLTPKKILDNVMDTIGACVAPMIPIFTAAGLIKLIAAIVGPSMLNIMPDSSHFIQLLTFVGDAGFYFFPVYVAYGAAKKFKVNIPMALFVACIMLHPTLVEIVNAGEPFDVYGIPMTLTTYSSNFISTLMVIWVMSYVEKLLNKFIPTYLRTLLFPLLLTLIMLPIALCIVGPLGSVLGEGIAQFIVSLNKVVGPITIAIVAALWPLLITTGMHQALIAIALSYIATVGYDDSILVGAIVSNYPMIAISLSYLILAKTVSKKSYATTSFLTLVLGGISEPTLFGIILNNKKAILSMMIGGFIGGLYAGIMKVAVYFVGAGNFMVCLGFAGERVQSLFHGIIACLISFVVTFVLCMIFKFDDMKEEDSNEKNLISE